MDLGHISVVFAVDIPTLKSTLSFKDKIKEKIRESNDFLVVPVLVEMK